MLPLLVIGAGPTGLAVAKALAENAIEHVHVEATDHVGGNWAHGVYSTAHIISSRKTTQYDDFPMPEDYPDFPSAEQMRRYFEAYADRFELRRNLRFQTRVVRVVPLGEGARDGWRVTLADAQGEHDELFRGVLVCNGHHWARSFPAWAGPHLASAGPGTPAAFIRHSKDFHHPDELRDRRVLVVGGGNSGSDVICEAARVATRADWSLRRGYWFMPKTVFGKPSIELIQPWLPVAAQRLVMKSLIGVVVGSYAKYGLPKPDHDLFEAHPTVSTEVFHYLKHGRVHVRPDVQSVDPERRTVTFVDGVTETYDLIVCATGYDVSFPFLPDGMVPVRGKVAELWAGMFRPQWRHLWVLGTTQPRYGIGPLLRPMAELVAQWVKLQDELPIPLGAVLESLGLAPPKTHLVDPHAALRLVAVAKRLGPLLRWRGRALAGRSAAPTAPSTQEAKPPTRAAS